MIRDTSLKAYFSIVPNLGDRQMRVFRAIKEIGPVSDREVCRYLGFVDPNIVRPRRRELVKLGLVSEDIKRECKITRRQVITWKVR